MFYVYELFDPRDLTVFYVGKGKAGRIHQHELEARKGRQSRKCERIREIEAAGLAIGKRKVSHHKEEVEAYDAEIERIALHGLANLTNVASGGGGKSTGPTLYEDRILISRVTPLIVRTKNIEAVVLLGQRMDLAPIKEMMRETVLKVIERRSLAWVNEIAARYRAEFKAEAESAAA